MFSAIWNDYKPFFNRVKETIKKYTKPATISLVADAISDVTRTRPGSRECDPLSTADCSQTTSKTAEIHRWRPVSLTVSLSFAPVLG